MESSGFTHLHVSGLPANCGEDAEIEAALWKALTRPLLCIGNGTEEDPEHVSQDNEAEQHTVESSALLKVESEIGCADMTKDGRTQNTTEGSDGETEEASEDTLQCAANVSSSPNDESSIEGGLMIKEGSTPSITLGSAINIEEASAIELQDDADRSPLPKDESGIECGNVTNEEQLQKADAGNVCDSTFAKTFLTCTVLRNKETGACKGYCFLAFSSRSAAEAAMHTLNAGVEVAGAKVKAQISQPKERQAKPKDAGEDLHDLRLRRQRYQPPSKHAIRGHATCSDKSVKMTRWTGRVADKQQKKGRPNH